MTAAKHTPAASHPMRPTVSVDGRRVTVSFDMPFMVGDACITPRHYEETRVAHVPEVAIRLHRDLECIDIHCGGSWYTASHSQLHGANEFLPDRAAFLEYWLSAKERTHFESHLPNLRRLFADAPDALKRLQDRHVEILQAEIATTKQTLGATVVASTRHILGLESAIAAATGASE